MSDDVPELVAHQYVITLDQWLDESGQPLQIAVVLTSDGRAYFHLVPYAPQS
jgi:hypothetical protein